MEFDGRAKKTFNFGDLLALEASYVSFLIDKDYFQVELDNRMKLCNCFAKKFASVSK